MPDPARRTISATQAPALWNASPYVTRWMLWKHFHDALPIDSPPDSRMNWGTKLQPLIIEQAAADLAMEVKQNPDIYVRRGQLGCTRDAIVICPDRGPGALETKCVFDYRTWMSDWNGGETIPRNYEIQLQQQMLVGEANGEPYRWGVVAAWIAGDVHYFERAPIPDLWDYLKNEAAEFFRSIEANEEPDPFGVPIEIPFLSQIEREPGTIVELADADLAADAKAYSEYGKTISELNKSREQAKARLLAASDEADELHLPGGISVKIKTQNRGAYDVKPTTFVTVKVNVPRGDE